MGTDIHGFAEWKSRSMEDIPQAWNLIAPIPDLRNYQTFELLANVRETGDIHRTFADDIPLRGLPSYYETLDEIHGQPVLWQHSKTWYTLQELYRPSMWEQLDHRLPLDLWLTFLRYLALFRVATYNCDVRIVIGFDC